MKLIIVCALLAAGTAVAATPADFRRQAPLTGEYPGEYLPAKVTLTAEVISQTRDRFADLRIFDQTGTETAYVILPEITRAEPRRAAELEIVKFEDLAGAGIRITLKSPKDWTATEGLEIRTGNRDFEKTVKVEISRDGATWQPHAAGMIFNYAAHVDLQNRAVAIPRAEAPFFRLAIGDNKTTAAAAEQISLQYKDLRFRSDNRSGAPFRIDGVTAWRGKNEQEIRVYDRTPLPTGDKLNGDTVINLTAVNLPLAQVEFDIGTKYFYRPVELQARGTDRSDRWNTLATGVIYRLPDNDKPNLLFSKFTGKQSKDLRLVIRDGNNEPLIVNGVTGLYVRQNLYFLPRETGAYRLLFDSPRVNTANYDLASVLKPDAELLNQAAVWQIGPAVANPDYKRDFLSDAETDGLAGKIFKGLIIALVLLLVLWTWRAIKKLQ